MGERQKTDTGMAGEQKLTHAKPPNHFHLIWTLKVASILLGLLSAISATEAIAQSNSVRAVVNSSQDTVQADNALTLREAILVVNGTLSLSQLSTAEQGQVTSLSGESSSQIAFNLPAGDTTIRLVDLLPAIDRAGTTIDGTTQPGYSNQSIINEQPIAAPIVAITPAAGSEVLRGLIVTADGVTIRGLSLYGFTSTKGEPFTGFASGFGFTQSTPPADIFISHRLSPPNTRKQQPPANFSPYYSDDFPPKQVVIENNWLGVPPLAETDGRSRETFPADSPLPASPANRSAFGVSVFNGASTSIQRNLIAYHDGSAIITSVAATDMNVSQNVIIGNGVAGMPDAIRLEGNVSNSRIAGNLICANDGSGVYLFKPQGSVQIQDNQLIYNGRRLRRAAVYLMGSHHTVSNNEIRNQAGPGVVVASYPKSQRDTIQGNRFSNLEGLSIDLVTQDGAIAGTDVHDYQTGDGPNPPRNSFNRRKDTGNAAIQAPQFVSKEFISFGSNPVQVYGAADPNSQVDIYRVAGTNGDYGPLSEPVATVTTDASGNFSTTLEGLQVGEQISAIATHPLYGTSEPARNAVIRSTNMSEANRPTAQPPTSIPRCVTPVAQQPPEVPPGPVTLKIPNVIHFALDRSDISSATARVLNRISEVLRENPSILVEIVGHTDPRATDAYNQALGLRRATSARNYLLKQGIAPERLTIRSEGEQQLVSPGRTRLDFARDRRVEFIYKDAREIEVIVQEDDLQIEP